VIGKSYALRKRQYFLWHWVTQNSQWPLFQTVCLVSYQVELVKPQSWHFVHRCLLRISASWCLYHAGRSGMPGHSKFRDFVQTLPVSVDVLALLTVMWRRISCLVWRRCACCYCYCFCYLRAATNIISDDFWAVDCRNRDRYSSVSCATNN